VPTFRSTDGLEIAYTRSGADPSGPPVLLHHGFGASGEIDWVDPGTVAALTAAGREVVTLDARGHGGSAKPHDPARYGETRMAADVSTLLDVLGVEQVDLAGYSMGAVVSLVTAAREPRVRRLVVGGIGAGAVELGGVDSRVLDPEVLADALLADDASRVTHPHAAAFRAFADSTGADRLALAAQASSVHRERLPLDDVRVPTLVLAGREDPLAGRPEVLAAALPDARLCLVDGDHGAVLRNPDFAAAIVDFLAEGR
jgi:pimeloyl-ACP methyl ester carboxylesterase